MGPYSLVSDFQKEFSAAKSVKSKGAILVKFAKKIEDGEEALEDDKAALSAVAHAASIPLPQSLSETKLLPQPGAEERPDAEKRRCNRAIKTLIAFWSHQVVKKYRWELYSWKILERLVKLAQKWDLRTFIGHANRQLLDRQKRSISSSSVLRIGQHHSQSKNRSGDAPLETQEIVAIERNRDQCLEPEFEAYVRKWTEPCACELGELGIEEERLPFFSLERDKFGLLIPGKVVLGVCHRCAGHRMPSESGNVNGISQPVKPSESGPTSSGASEVTEETSLLSPQPSPRPSPRPGPRPGPKSPMPIFPASSTIYDKTTIEYTSWVNNAELFQHHYDRLQREAHLGPQYLHRAEWFHKDLKLAKVWAPPKCKLGKELALSESDADVWHLTMDEFIAQTKRGEPFIRPVLIKNCKHNDTELHSVTKYLDILDQVYRNKDINVKSLDSIAPKKMNVADFRKVFTTGKSNFNALNLSNMTKGFRPLFTMLEQFKILDILAEALRPTSGKQTQSVPVDIASCLEFNILADGGAFSGPHVDALGGYTSVRNLEGCKLWITIPPQTMKDHWESFNRLGPDWPPPQAMNG